MKDQESMTKSEDIHRMLLNMALAPISTSIAAYKTAIKEITAYINDLEEKQVPKKIEYVSDGDAEDSLVWEYRCPVCEEELYRCNYYAYCPYCGQAIDWEDEE